MKQELLTLPGNMDSRPVFSGVRVAQSLVFCVVYCGSLFVHFFWSLHFISFDLRLLITPLVSSNFFHTSPEVGITHTYFSIDRHLLS